MREAIFVKQNISRWEEFERLINDERNANPDVLADLFIKLTDDLSFARTQFPDSETVAYLNSLASKVHQAIYKNKKESKNRIITFWTEELPALMPEVWPYMGYSLIIFIVGIIIGCVSTANDESYVRAILGDYYVNMTLENIENGTPMGVYGNESEINMLF